MAENERANAKLAQYLVEAYGKEKELETALTAHISMTDRKPYKKRLQEHLKETKNHARLVERRIKKLDAGGTVGNLVKEGASAVKRGTALAKGPLHMVRGTGDEEKMLKNAKTEYSEEHEEIATYTAIETLAEQVGDKETAKIARQIRREEERMARFLAGQIPVLTKAVAKAEIPAAERRTSSGSSRRRSTGAGSTSGRSTGGRKRSSGGGARKRSSGARKSSSSSSRSSSSRKTTSKKGR